MPGTIKSTDSDQKKQLHFYPYSISHINIPNDNTSGQNPHSGDCFVQIFAREQTSSQRICIQTLFTPYFYISLKGADKKKIDQFLKDKKQIKQTSETNLLLFGDEEEFLKVETYFPEQIRDLEKNLIKTGLKIFEADIPIHRRFLVDKKITPLKLTSAKVAKVAPKQNKSLNIPLYLAEPNSFSQNTDLADKSAEPSQTISFPKTLAIDIETYNEIMHIDMQKNPILMVALYGEEINKKTNKTTIYKKVLTYKTPNGSPVIKDKQVSGYTEILENEKEMLKRFQECIKEFNPEFLTSYFGDGFDMPYIKKRADILNLKLSLAPDNSGIWHSGITVKKALIKGIPHLDIFKFIRYIYGVYWKIDSYSLDNVAYKLLKEKKIDVDLNKLAPAWNTNNKELELFIKYNLQDSKITHALTKKVWQSITEFCAIVGIMPDDLIRMRFSRLVENFLLKQANNQQRTKNQNQIIQPQRPSQKQISFRMTKHIEGAFVLQPKPNLYEDVVIFDFLSLYPTIIISHNIGRETVLTKSKLDKLPKNQKPKQAKLTKVPERTYQINNEKTSFIAQELGIIVDKRVELKKQLKELKIANSTKSKASAHSTTTNTDQQIDHVKSQLDALKVLANSFYGYFAFYGARWYSFEGADSITAFARNYIKDVIKKAELAGFPVIYSDTDSIMITLKDPSTKEQIKTQKQAHEFVNKINETLPGSMELEFEGFFPRAIFVASKGDKDKTTGAKKKYAMIDEEDNLKIVGFETVRRNWSKVAKVTQKEFLRLVLTNKQDEAMIYLKQVIKDLKEHKLTADQLILKMQLKQPVDKYKSIGPHVKVAKDMIKKGIDVKAGTLIEYIVKEGTGPIRDRAIMPQEFQENNQNKKQIKYDVKYYLNNQLLPSIESILNVLNIKIDQLTKESSQSGLGGFI